MNKEMLEEATGQQVKLNQRHLEHGVAKCLDCIMSPEALAQVPGDLRTVAFVLKRVVTSKFPRASHAAVGGLLFLRVICPAIIAPQAWLGLEVPRSAKRNLVLLSKLLQSLSNGVPFKVKEKYMVPCNPFLEKHFAQVADFLSCFATIPASQGLNFRHALPNEHVLRERAKDCRCHLQLLKDLLLGSPRDEDARRVSFDDERRGWVKDEDVFNCQFCDRAFGALKRKHHCRACGGIFCSECSNKRIPVPRLDNTPRRVCLPCYTRLRAAGRARSASHGK